MTPYILIIAGAVSLVSGLVLLIRQQASSQPVPVAVQQPSSAAADITYSEQAVAAIEPAKAREPITSGAVKAAPVNIAASSLEDEGTPTAVEKGAAFEKWVIDHTNRQYWKMVEWQGDKFHKGVYAESNRYPDMLFNVTRGSETHKISLECKWRSRFNQQGSMKWATAEQIAIYNKYAAERNVPVFAVIGVGGSPSSPDEVYTVPLRALNSPNVSREKLQSFRGNKQGYFYYNFDSRRLYLRSFEQAK